MKSSRIVEYSAIFLIVFLLTAGCVFPKQQQDPNNNSTSLVTPSVPIMTLSEKNVGNNDTYWRSGAILNLEQYCGNHHI